MRISPRAGAVSKRVILNCLITWSTRCARRPLGRRPAICPHGTGAPAGPHAARANVGPRMQISTQASGSLRSVVRRLLRVPHNRETGRCVRPGLNRDQLERDFEVSAEDRELTVNCQGPGPSFGRDVARLCTRLTFSARFAEID